MYQIFVEKECGCFKKNGYENNQTFPTKEEALMEAEEMVEEMNETFCQKHYFDLEEQGNRIIITVRTN